MLTIAAILFVAALLTSALGTFLAKRYAIRLGLMDAPGHRKVHTTATPRNGGIGIFCGIALPAVAAIIGATLFPNPPVPESLQPHVAGLRAHVPLMLLLLVCTAAIHILGLLDDRKPMAAWPKLLLQIAAAAALVGGGELLGKGAFRTLTFLDTAFPGGAAVSGVISVLWIVALTNAFNFLDNMDGLSAGVAFICALMFLVAASLAGQWFICGLLVVFMGAVAGFLFFNFPPASIFMGDGGSMVLGFFLSALTIRTTYYGIPTATGEKHWYTLLMPLIILAVPLYDLVIVSVLRIAAGKSPMTGDTNHFSHRLTRHGFSKRGAVLVIYAVTLATGLSAPLLTLVRDTSGAALVGLQTLAMLVVIGILERVGSHTHFAAPPAALAGEKSVSARAGKNSPVDSLPAPSRPHWPAWCLLAGLLCVMSLRLTLTETLRPTISTRVWFASAAPGDHFIGPMAGTTIGLSILTLALAGAAACVRRLSRLDWLALALIAGTAVLLAASTFGAANKFAALVGSLDLLAAMLGGWAVGLLAREPRAKKLVVAVLMGVLAAWVARGAVEHFVDNPEVFDYYTKHKTEALAQNGIQPGSPQETAFWYRMKSGEISGFISLSNLYANGLVGLAAAALGVILGGIFGRKPAADSGADRAFDGMLEYQSKRKKLPSKTERQKEIPLFPIFIGVLVVLVLAGVWCVIKTESKGGAAATVLGMVAVGVVAWRVEWVRERRKFLLAGVAIVCAAGVAGVLGYGLARDTLPSKSMMFRWHYWTASAPMIGQHAGLGVGMNNFGDYYSSYKRPSSPEDVKDPHSFFVRLAAEAGVPAAILAAGLLAVYAVGAARKRRDDEAPPAGRDAIVVIATGAVVCIVWWVAHCAFGEPDNAYSAAMSAVYGGVALLALAITAGLMDEMTVRGQSIVTAGLLIGAACMLLYDQVNMALVTGPVAMMFWVMLTAGSSREEESAPARSAGVVAALAGGALIMGSLVLAVFVWWPQSNGKFSWGPGPFEQQYAEHVVRAAASERTISDPPLAEGQPPRALPGPYLQETAAAVAALEEAAKRAPREVGILHASIHVKTELNTQLNLRDPHGKSDQALPIGAEVRRLLDLDRANADFRVRYGEQESDLPAKERAAILEEALRLDGFMPEGEAKKLTDTERARVGAKIVALRAQ